MKNDIVKKIRAICKIKWYIRIGSTCFAALMVATIIPPIIMMAATIIMNFRGYLFVAAFLAANVFLSWPTLNRLSKRLRPSIEKIIKEEPGQEPAESTTLEGVAAEFSDEISSVPDEEIEKEELEEGEF